MAAELEVEAGPLPGQPLCFCRWWRRLRRLGKPLALLSDMYLPADFLQELVDGGGVRPVFLLPGVRGGGLSPKGRAACSSGCGRRFPPGTSPLPMWGTTLTPTGAMARSTGDCSRLLPQRSPGAGDPYRPEDLSPRGGQRVPGHGQRQASQRSAKSSLPLYEYGFVYGGLFALGYCRFIRQWAEQQPARTGCCSSPGTGRLCSTLYRRLYPEDPRPVYAYWSRLAAAKVCAGLFPADYFRRFLIAPGRSRAFPWSRLLRGDGALPSAAGAVRRSAASPLKRP